MSQLSEIIEIPTQCFQIVAEVWILVTKHKRRRVFPFAVMLPAFRRAVKPRVIPTTPACLDVAHRTWRSCTTKHAWELPDMTLELLVHNPIRFGEAHYFVFFAVLVVFLVVFLVAFIDLSSLLGRASQLVASKVHAASPCPLLREKRALSNRVQREEFWPLRSLEPSLVQ